MLTAVNIYRVLYDNLPVKSFPNDRTVCKEIALFMKKAYQNNPELKRVVRATPESILAYFTLAVRNKYGSIFKWSVYTKTRDNADFVMEDVFPQYYLDYDADNDQYIYSYNFDMEMKGVEERLYHTHCPVNLFT